jgi:hypothetical protein
VVDEKVGPYEIQKNGERTVYGFYAESKKISVETKLIFPQT